MNPEKTILTLALLAVALLCFAPLPALARGNAEAGKEKSTTCQACHGADGNAIDPMYPRISGQYEDYLARSLREYRGGTRKNVIMAGFATMLTDQDILDLAAYYSSLPGELGDMSTNSEAK
ncbi:MAG: cytochrome c [Dokdonella sp.]